MTTKRTRISQLKGILALQKKRSNLLDRLAKLERQIGEKLEQEVALAASVPALGATAARGASSKPAQVVIKAKAASRTETRGRRGALKEQIIAELEKAGEKGISVRDLADRLGTKPANLHTWFSTNSSRVPGLKKIAAGQFAIGGKAAKASKPTKATKAAPAKALKATKAPKAAKASKATAAKASKSAAPAKATTGRKKASGEFVPAKRGEMKNNILDALKQVGSGGITIKDLADKVGTRYKNLYIWFVTTGKRIPGIEKVGPAKYRLVG